MHDEAQYNHTYKKIKRDFEISKREVLYQKAEIGRMDLKKYSNIWYIKRST